MSERFLLIVGLAALVLVGFAPGAAAGVAVDVDGDASVETGSGGVPECLVHAHTMELQWPPDASHVAEDVAWCAEDPAGVTGNVTANATAEVAPDNMVCVQVYWGWTVGPVTVEGHGCEVHVHGNATAEA